MRIAVLLVAVTSLLALAAPAGAATVTGGTHIEGGVKSPEVSVFDLSIAGTAGETSDLTVTLSGNVHVVVADSAAPLTAAGTCTQASPTVVACDAPSALGRFTADLGDGNDRLRFVTPGPAFASSILAGPGDDDITGGPLFDSLDGGGGTDVLRGGAGNDTLVDGDVSGAANADTLDGGPGEDAVSYETRTAALVIDLPAGRAGEAGEGDGLTGVESASGGAGADTLTGTGAANSLDGGSGGPDVIVAGGGADFVSLGGGGRASAGTGADSIDCGDACTVDAGSGNDDFTGSDEGDRIRAGAGRDEVNTLDDDDRIDGGPGNDVLGGGFAEGVAGKHDGHDRISGGGGNDRLVDSTDVDRYDGGPGRDLILASDRRADRVRCGAGRDRLVGDRRERARGCERRQVGAHVRFTGSRRQEIIRRVFFADLACPVYALVSCRGRIEARLGGTLVGRARYRGTGDLLAEVKLTAAGRRLLRNGGTVTVIARGGDATGAVRSVRRTYRLRR